MITFNSFSTIENINSTIAKSILAKYEINLNSKDYDKFIGFLQESNQYELDINDEHSWSHNNPTIESMTNDVMEFINDLCLDCLRPTHNDTLEEEICKWYYTLTTRQKLIIFLINEGSLDVEINTNYDLKFLKDEIIYY